MIRSRSWIKSRSRSRRSSSKRRRRRRRRKKKKKKNLSILITSSSSIIHFDPSIITYIYNLFAINYKINVKKINVIFYGYLEILIFL